MTDTQDYDYDLPRELIAQFPLRCRTDARLLVVDRQRGTLEHSHIRDLARWLRPSDLLVLNDTRVLPARLVGYRVRTGGKWEGLFLSTSDQGVWHVLGRTRGKLQPGEQVQLVDRSAQEALRLTMLADLGGGQWAARPGEPTSAVELLERIGRVPLPGYIRGGRMEESDQQTYQTVFAVHPGSVAAPTAGLHFTNELLAELERASVKSCRVTLHVGVGTFRPITATRLEDHVMHTEWASVGADAVAGIDDCRRRGGRVVAVGTTVVRTLESAAAELPLRALSGETRLFIRPPYNFRIINGLLTNFHLPRSTLLVLVRTFGGDALIREAYAEAIRECYRFYSYGDAMLIL